MSRADGPLLVLVHGMEDGPDSWAPLAGLLGRQWRTRALDLPWRAGNGYRWRRRGSPGSLLAQELAALGEPAAVLIGHSFGANAVLELLADTTVRPVAPRPSAVVLTAPFYRPPELAVTWELFDSSRENFDRQIQAGITARLGSRLATVDPELVATMTDKAIARIGPVGFLSVFDQFVASGELPLAGVDVPTLVLSGRGDPSLGRRRSAALDAAMPAATVVVSDHYDHFCHVRQTGDVARRITEFLGTTTLSGPTDGGSTR
jgi:pimeloyl-ACP methyl ester carboxylesterase